MTIPIVALLDNIRSAHNVGSILRTADAAGIEAIICCGYTPYPSIPSDPRTKFEAARTTKLLAKTALGAETTVPVRHFGRATDALEDYRHRGYQIVALEQAPNSINLFDFKPSGPILMTLGHEVEGTSQELLPLVNQIIEIPMHGQKESLNVSVAAGIALYHLRQHYPTAAPV